LAFNTLGEFISVGGRRRDTTTAKASVSCRLLSLHSLFLLYFLDFLFFLVGQQRLLTVQRRATSRQQHKWRNKSEQGKISHAAGNYNSSVLYSPLTHRKIWGGGLEKGAGSGRGRRTARCSVDSKFLALGLLFTVDYTHSKE